MYLYFSYYSVRNLAREIRGFVHQLQVAASTTQQYVRRSILIVTNNIYYKETTLIQNPMFS